MDDAWIRKDLPCPWCGQALEENDARRVVRCQNPACSERGRRFLPRENPRWPVDAPGPEHRLQWHRNGT